MHRGVSAGGEGPHRRVRTHLCSASARPRYDPANHRTVRRTRWGKYLLHLGQGNRERVIRAVRRSEHLREQSFCHQHPGEPLAQPGSNVFRGSTIIGGDVQCDGAVGRQLLGGAVEVCTVPRTGAAHAVSVRCATARHMRLPPFLGSWSGLFLVAYERECRRCGTQLNDEIVPVRRQHSALACASPTEEA